MRKNGWEVEYRNGKIIKKWLSHGTHRKIRPKMVPEPRTQRENIINKIDSNNNINL